MHQIVAPHTKHVLTHTSFVGEQEEHVVSARDIIAEKLPYRIERKKDSHGVFFKLNINELVFLGNAAAWLRQKFELRGIQTNITLEVGVRVNGRYKTFDPKKLDFAKVKFSDREVKIGLLDTSFIEESEKSKDKKVKVVPDRKIILRGQEIQFISKGYIDSFYADPQLITNANYPNTSPPFTFEVHELNEVFDLSFTPGQPCYINRSNTDTTIELNYGLRGVMMWNVGGTITSGVATTHIDVAVLAKDSDGNTTSSVPINRIGGRSFGVGTSGTVSTLFSGVITPLVLSVLPGGSIVINIEFRASAYNPLIGSISVGYESNRDVNFLTLTDQTQAKDSESDAITIHNAFNHTLNNRFISNYFAPGGCGASLVLAKGAWVRKLQKALYLSFNDLFQNLSKILGLGYSYEKHGDEWYVRVEPINHFYNTAESSSIILNNIDRYSIQKSISLDYAYSSVKVGYKYKEKDYNITNAAAEDFHTQHTYETPLQGIVKKELNLVSDFIASGFGVRAQQQRIATQSEDSKLDEEVFLIALIDAASNLSKQNEGYANVSGIFATDTAMNLGLSPKRNLLRHYPLLTSALQKTDASESITFKGAERNTSLVTTSSDTCQENTQVVESSDLPAKGVTSPFFTSEKIIIQGVKGFSQLDVILSNPYAPISFTTQGQVVEGFVISIQGEDLRRNNFTLELLEKYK